MPKGVYPHKSRDRAARFWEKVDVRGPNDCWPWGGYRMAFFWGEGTYPRPERAAWILEVGPVDSDTLVLRRCPTEACCNTRHYEAMSKFNHPAFPWKWGWEKFERNFWDKVMMGTTTQCWPWLGFFQGKEGGHAWYGVVNVGGHLRGAHRIAWALANRSQPPEGHVHHDCGITMCCNWRHMTLHTASDHRRVHIAQKAQTKRLRRAA